MAVVAQAVYDMARTLCPDRPRIVLAILAAILALGVQNTWGQLGAIAAGGLCGWWLLRSDADAEVHPLPLSVPKPLARGALIVFFVLLAGLPALATSTDSQILRSIDSFSRAGSLLFGRLYDRRGFDVIVVLTLASAAFAPLVFLGGFGAALAGVAVWGLAMGVHDSIIPAAVATMVPAQRRATAFGIFTAGYGIAWFAGSALIGVLYDRSLAAAIAFCVVAELAAVPILVVVGRRLRARLQ